jgi:integrase
MPRRSEGPHLKLERAEIDAGGKIVRHASWIIRDGKRKVRTGCRADEAREAQKRLAAYITEQHAPARERDRHPSQVDVADVISVYVDDVTGRLKRPREIAARLGRVLEHFGDKKVSAVTGATCRAYAASRGNAGAARRELEDFRAAINHYHQEGFLETPVAVVLPEKGPSRERWLTRSEVARLIWAAWRYREIQKGHATGRASRKHVARFILVALYTGTRAGAICGAAIRPTVGSGFVDLEQGTFYRRAPGSRETKKRQPPIRMHPRLLAHLRRWEAKGIAKKWVVEWRGQKVGRINKAFCSAREGAGLGADVIPHALRHTAATVMLQNGCPAWEAAGYLGMTLETIENVYGHHSPDHFGGAVQSIGTRKMSRRDAINGTDQERRAAK